VTSASGRRVGHEEEDLAPKKAVKPAAVARITAPAAAPRASVLHDAERTAVRTFIGNRFMLFISFPLKTFALTLAPRSLFIERLHRANVLVAPSSRCDRFIKLLRSRPCCYASPIRFKPRANN
jgi:hypothetical protein